jgi:hypothetical protein
MIEIMRKTNLFILFIIIISGLIMLPPACGTSEDQKDETDTVKNFVAKSFSVGNYNFAIRENNKFIPYNKAIYHRGDEVFLVLENVGPFLLGPDSLNHAEMKLKVTDAIGQPIVARDSLFGAAGHKRFVNNTIPSPYGSFESLQKNLPGKYTICVTIFDLIRKDSIVVCDDFYLE